MDRASFLVQVRHFGLLLDLKMYLTSPAVSILRNQILTTTQGQPEVRSFPFCMILSSLVWSGVAFDRWPTHRYVLRTVFQVIELEACHEVIALSRRDQDSERILVLPRLFALPQWPLPFDFLLGCKSTSTCRNHSDL